LLDKIKNTILYLYLIITSILVLGPIFWFLSTSLKRAGQVAHYPPKWIPDPITFDNYRRVLFHSSIIRYFINSIIVAIGTILVTAALASMIAYAAARFKFKGKNVILFILLSTAMIPGIAILPALYVMSVVTGLHDTYFILILVFSAWQIPTSVWILLGFFQSIPTSIDESALIDGCNRLQVFTKIMIPLAKPGIAAASIVMFIHVWNDWLMPATLTISSEMRVITVGLYFYISDIGIQWGRFTAYTIMAMIPVIILFLILQEQFIEGLTAGAQKG